MEAVALVMNHVLGPRIPPIDLMSLLQNAMLAFFHVVAMIITYLLVARWRKRRVKCTAFRGMILDSNVCSWQLTSSTWFEERIEPSPSLFNDPKGGNSHSIKGESFTFGFAIAALIEEMA